ncbi:MAG: pantoate--beta-alanine ligase [Chloroflexi bacterium]|nr:MAG: pantoate--beta-alanine ligase [Chloroflexota bacterium]
MPTWPKRSRERRRGTSRKLATVPSQGLSTSTQPTVRGRPQRNRGKRSSTAPARQVDTPAAMLDASRRWRGDGKSIGLVPTMGALHAGHLSLVDLARRENDLVVASVFVNPIQFAPGEDFERYPRDPIRDAELLEQSGVDAIYRPSVEAMYPPEARTRVHVSGVSEPLEGVARPGHFEGVATVVSKLLIAVAPDRAYFGQKDAQQVAVVKRLVRDLDLGVEIRVGPTVREADGVALSSRNVYLSAEERSAAASLCAALRMAADAYAAGERDPDRLRSVLRSRLEAEPLAVVDYAEVVDPGTFRGPGTLAVLAVRIGRTRLIDNHDLSLEFPG